MRHECVNNFHDQEIDRGTAIWKPMSCYVHCNSNYPSKIEKNKNVYLYPTL